eukprot:1962222-Pleurochrysis_carterae.AAC.1
MALCGARGKKASARNEHSDSEGEVHEKGTLAGMASTPTCDSEHCRTSSARAAQLQGDTRRHAVVWCLLLPQSRCKPR